MLFTRYNCKMFLAVSLEIGFSDIYFQWLKHSVDDTLIYTVLHFGIKLNVF